MNCIEGAQMSMVLDFTGTDLDTKAECQALGLLFSDNDTPFPDELYAPCNGTWTHVEGVGWKAACAVNSEGPSIIIPLVRSYNWEMAVTFEYAVSDVAELARLILGTMMPNNDYGIVAFSQDNNAGASELACLFYTNDGDDTITVRFTGDPLAGVGERVIKIRSLNCCASVYDQEDSVWEDYTGRQAPVSYTPTHLFVQVQKIGAAALSDITIKNITITYS
jgi:hypothetical protein